jgi:uncharacterized protein (TIGR03790 family)
VIRWTLLFGLLAATAAAQKPDEVLIVVNQNSALSKTVGEYYARRRAIPARNVCRLRVTDDEEIPRSVYDSAIAHPIGEFLRTAKLVESIKYIVTTAGVPLRIGGATGMEGDVAAVDSELTLLYKDLHGAAHPSKGMLANPFFGRQDRPFSHPEFPIYLVTRLAGYDFNDIRKLIDHSLAARNRGRFVIDLRAGEANEGDDWMRAAAAKLPKDRLLLEETTSVLYGVKDVIAFASWGSNDFARHKRFLGFEWLPGAIMTEFVSTNARTFKRPPDSWNIGAWKDDPRTFFGGAPQTLTADYIHEGATGASGHVAEPFLGACPRPNLLLPAYASGRTLAESYYLAIPALSWQNVVIGDPLCSLGKP